MISWSHFLDDLRRMAARTRAGAPGAGFGWSLVAALAVVSAGVWFGFHPGQSSGSVDLVIGASSLTTDAPTTVATVSSSTSERAPGDRVIEAAPAGPAVKVSAPIVTEPQPVTTQRITVTTRRSTTAAPTTAAPITVAPTTTAAPTTVAPTTTAAPTTVAPTTTAAPTTVAPTTTAAPTTVAPTTTAAPTTTVAPTTTTTVRDDDDFLEEFCRFFPRSRLCR